MPTRTARIEEWLQRIADGAQRNPQLAVELAQCQRLVKGYSDTHERGLRNYDTVMRAFERAVARRWHRPRCANCATRRWPTNTATSCRPRWRSTHWPEETKKMTAPSATLSLRVVEARELNPLIRMLRLRADDARALPGFAAGAHIRVQVSLPDGKTDWRHYSLINFATARNATNAPTEYVIAVRKEAEGRGGSRFMHEQLKEGDALAIEAPKNDFPLHTGPGGSVLVAGGIGVTPLATMAARRRAEERAGAHALRRPQPRADGLPARAARPAGRRPARACRRRSRPAAGHRCAARRRTGGRPPLRVRPQGHARRRARAHAGARLGARPRALRTVHRGRSPKAGDQPFEVELAQSGQRFTVAADQSLLDCLIENGCDPMFDCKRGECGVCAVPVIEGEIDHRDYVLTAREKAEGNVMQICISRAKGARLVLDI
jgi:ferredoxin